MKPPPRRTATSTPSAAVTIGQRRRPDDLCRGCAQGGIVPPGSAVNRPNSPVVSGGPLVSGGLLVSGGPVGWLGIMTAGGGTSTPTSPPPSAESIVTAVSGS